LNLGEPAGRLGGARRTAGVVGLNPRTKEPHMSRPRSHRIFFAVVGLIAAGSLVFPVVAQQLGVAGNDVGRAREMAGLVAIGQLKLADATALAERQVGGIALDARVDLQTDETGRTAAPPAAPVTPGAPITPGAKREPASYGKKLVYEVTV